MEFIFLHAFRLKFIINANIVYILVESKFIMSILCPNHYDQFFLQLVYRCVYCVLTYLIEAL